MKKIKITESQLKRINEQTEDFNPDDLESPELSISPQSQLKYAYRQYGWKAYIPEISKTISFYLNPEEWNLMGTIRVSNVESKGYGSFGDDSHKDYKESPLDNLHNNDGNVWYDGTVIGKGERYYHVDIKEAVNDIKNYSEEAAELTIQYKQQIQQLTKQFADNLGSLKEKHNFAGSGDQLMVSVDSEGKVKTEDEYDEEGTGHDLSVWHTLYGNHKKREL